MIEAIITGAVAILVCMINNAFQQKRADEQHHTTITLIEYKLDQLEKKVEMHNNAVLRLTTLENEVQNIKENVKDHLS